MYFTTILSFAAVLVSITSASPILAPRALGKLCSTADGTVFGICRLRTTGCSGGQFKLLDGWICADNTECCVFPSATPSTEPGIGDGHINQHGINLIRSAEGLDLNIYNDQNGVPTIGYGHNCQIHGCPINPITEEIAEQYLKEDLANPSNRFEAMVCELPGAAGLNDNQFSALVDFAFNLGAWKAEEYLRTVFTGNLTTAISGIRANIRSWSPIDNRRDRELELFNVPSATLCGCGGGGVPPDTGVPGEVPPDTGVPGEVPPDTGVPGEVPPDTGVPGEVPPDTGVPGEVPPDTGLPGEVPPDTGVPGEVPPDTELPGEGVPEDPQDEDPKGEYPKGWKPRDKKPKDWKHKSWKHKGWEHKVDHSGDDHSDHDHSDGETWNWGNNSDDDYHPNDHWHHEDEEPNKSWYPTKKPTSTKPVPTRSATTKPASTKPASMKPSPTKPVSTKPTPTKPVPTKSVPTEPTSTESSSTKPASTKTTSATPTTTKSASTTKSTPTKPTPTKPTEVPPPAGTNPANTYPYPKDRHPNDWKWDWKNYNNRRRM